MLKKSATIGEKYRPAMEILDQSEADEYFELLVQHNMLFGHSREEAESIERQNLGYYAGYYDGEEVRARVERLFNCAHPVFGKVSERGSPSLEEAVRTGMELAAGKGKA